MIIPSASTITRLPLRERRERRKILNKHLLGNTNETAETDQVRYSDIEIDRDSVIDRRWMNCEQFVLEIFY